MTVLLRYEGQVTVAQELVNEGSFHQAIEIYTDILRAIPAETIDPDARKIRLQSLKSRGDVLIQCEMPKTAIVDYEQWYQEAEESSESIAILCKIAKHYSMIGEAHTALKIGKEAQVLLHFYPTTPLQEAAVYRVLGYIRMNLGQLDEAHREYQKAFDLLESLDEKLLQATILNEIAIVDSRQSILDKSIKAYEQSLAFYKELELHRATAIVLSNLGESYQQLFDFETALQYHQEALSMLTEDDKSQKPSFLCNVYRNIGLDLNGLGQFEASVQYFKRAISVNHIIRDRNTSMQLFNSCALSELSQGNVVAAQEMVQKCLDIANSCDAKSHRAQAHYISGLIHQELYDLATANREWQKAIYLAHETGQSMLLWQIHAAMAECITNTEITEVHYEIAADIIDQVVAPFTDDTIREKFLNAPQTQAVLNKMQL